MVGVLPGGAGDLVRLRPRRLGLRVSGQAHFVAEVLGPQPLVVTCAGSDRGRGGH